MSTSKAALAGLRVIEFGGFAAGPAIGKHLGNYGADVIRVESHLRLDGFRFSYPPFKDNIPGPERAGIFNFYNDGKRSITLNLKHPRGQELARQLVARADVVIENFTPGTLERLGLRYSSLKIDNPGLILLSTCNQGQFGPHADHRGFGSQLTSLSGFSHVLGFPDRPPTLLYGPYIDYIAVGFGTAAVLAALYRRRRTHLGCEIDLSQYEAGLQFMTPALLDFVINGRVAERNGNRHPHAAPHGVFACRSEEREEWVALSVMDDAEWQRFVCALDSPGWAAHPRFQTTAGRKANEDTLESHLAAWTALLRRDEIVGRMRANDLRIYPVNSMADLFSDPQLAARGFWRTVEHPVMGPLRVEAPPALLRETPPVQERPAPLMGAHTAEVLNEILGLSPAQIDDLRTDGALD